MPQRCSKLIVENVHKLIVHIFVAVLAMFEKSINSKRKSKCLFSFFFYSPKELNELILFVLKQSFDTSIHIIFDHHQYFICKKKLERKLYTQYALLHTNLKHLLRTCPLILYKLSNFANELS